jgi:SAM-dependent methyltransferase
MGRRGIAVADDARWVFNRLAGDYAARPGYPTALVGRLLELAGGPGAAILDLGAGTGHLALPLARLGARVTAVEPARAMLAALAAAAPSGLAAVHASAEATGLAPASHDLAVVADALQWIEPERAGREIARVLRRGGAVAIVEARLADTPPLRALSALLAGANFKARPAPPGRREHLLAAAGARRAASERWVHAETLPAERLARVLRSLSYVGPALGPAALDALLTRAAALAGDGLAWERELTLTWALAGGR